MIRCLSLAALPFCAAIAVLGISFWRQFADPFIFFDDYASIRANADLYLNNAVHEGRWLNYLWNLRLWPTGAQTLASIYLLELAVFAAAISSALFPKPEELAPRLLAAMAVAVCPSLTYHSFWPGTLALAMAVLIVSVLALSFLGSRARIVGFVIAGAVLFLGYPIYPFLLLPIVLSAQNITVRNTPLWIGLAAVPVVIGAALALVINHLVTGSASLEVNDWRTSGLDEAKSGLLDLITMYPPYLLELGLEGWFGDTRAIEWKLPPNMPAQIYFAGLCLAALLVLRRRGAGAGLIVTFVAMLGFLTAVRILKGTTVPFTAASYIWFPLLLAIGRAAVGVNRQSRLLQVGLMGLVAIFGWQTRELYEQRANWQISTRSLGEELRGDDRPVALAGNLYNFPGLLEGGVFPRTLSGRLAEVSERQVLFCSDRPALCEAVPPNTGSGLQIRETPEATIVVSPGKR